MIKMRHSCNYKKIVAHALLTPLYVMGVFVIVVMPLYLGIYRHDWSAVYIILGVGVAVLGAVKGGELLDD